MRLTKFLEYVRVKVGDFTNFLAKKPDLFVILISRIFQANLEIFFQELFLQKTSCEIFCHFKSTNSKRQTYTSK